MLKNVRQMKISGEVFVTECRNIKDKAHARGGKKMGRRNPQLPRKENTTIQQDATAALAGMSYRLLHKK